MESNGYPKIYGIVSSFHYPPKLHRGAITLLSDSTPVLNTPPTLLQYGYSCTFDRFSVASTNFMYVIMSTFQKENIEPMSITLFSILKKPLFVLEF